ncbi:asparagine synthase (glutamine-hydrolyzing) [Aeromicrobium sp. CF3.5]|uniref:asparagine synthase (glutamine-hydrolyzing) n=1 Tax=Aeromicrobium sp. CF3.5 TaxID=3373078 RepID=UPI003EE5B728
MVHDLTGPAPLSSRLDRTRELGEEMLAELHHRGPDGSGTRQVGPTWLGHTRLAIVDLDGGEQPLRSPDGEHWVVANGEIYNHVELRARLGGDFRTSSDSEVVLRVVERLGTDGIHDMRGMYAWAVASRDGSLVLARDPLGVKPLYWARHDGRILAASELRAFPPEVRPFVEEFPPGHHWSSGGGLVAFVDLRTDPLGVEAGPLPAFTDRDRAKTAVRETLMTAVDERTMADVPVGVFLSGGLDSSIIAAILARLAPAGTPVHSFAAGTPDSSDLVAARVVADHLGLVHHERIYTDDDVVDALPDVVRSIESYEPSLVRSAVPNFLLSELAARHVKVVLTGEGADELFAGYHHLRAMDVAELRAALADGIDTLHHLNLQRCDRVTMAFGLEARVPFLSRDLLAVAGRIPMEWKLLGEDGHEQAQEKALLREAFEGWLPQEILWRRKEQFGDGSGTADVMARQAERLVPEQDWESEQIEGLPAARTREELGYQRIFAGVLAGVRAEQVLGRFATA